MKCSLAQLVLVCAGGGGGATDHKETAAMRHNLFRKENWLYCSICLCRYLVHLLARANDIKQLAEAYMHIKFNVCQRLQTTWSLIISSDEGSQRLQSVLNVFTCNSKPANAVFLPVQRIN